MQLLSDSEPEPDSTQNSIIFTPVASDSDFDELLESDSLGDRSTTSTVPTQNSQHSQGSTTSQYGVRKITGGLRRIDREDGYSRHTVVCLKILLWTSITLSVITTLFAILPTPEWLELALYYRCKASSSSITLCDPVPGNFTTLAIRLLKKRRLLTQTLFSNYRFRFNPYIWIEGWKQLHPLEYPAQIWLVYIFSFRFLIYYGGLLFGAIVVLDVAFLRILSRAISTKSTISRFALRDLEVIPVLAFIGVMPWESIIPCLLGVAGIIDNTDKKSVSDGIRLFIISRFFFRRVTTEWRRTSLLWRVLWLAYPLFSIVWLSLIVYMHIVGGKKVEVKMFQAKKF
ncbi:hypothetical protein TWF281_002707 [Arthrobotrys megalospora]